jgi:hypothetical protein
MNMNEGCEKYIKCLREYNKDIGTRYTTRRISFFNRDITENLYSLGYVETMSQNDNNNGSFFSDDDVLEDKYETLEMQLKQIPRRQPSVTTRRVKFGPANMPLKLHAKVRFKSIVEPRKFFQPYRIIGAEGEENSEFKHPLGKKPKIASYFVKTT